MGLSKILRFKKKKKKKKFIFLKVYFRKNKKFLNLFKRHTFFWMTCKKVLKSYLISLC